MNNSNEEPVDYDSEQIEPNHNEHVFEDIYKDGEEYIKGLNDYTDIIAKDQKKRTLKAIAVSVGSIAALVLLGFGVYMLMNDSEGREPTGPETTIKEQIEPSTNTPNTSETTAPAPETPTLPLLSLIETPKDTSKAQVKVEIGQNSISTTAGTTANFGNSTTTPPDTNCLVRAASDFCYAAELKTDKTTAHIYFMKDAAHSRIFENPKNFQKTSVNGATAAATMNVSVGSENNKPVLAIVFEDMSGLMITFDTEADAQAAASTINIG